MNLIRKYKFELFGAAIWLLSIASKYKFNGLVFGFDYGNYQPDGKFYTYMALDFIHHNPTQSAQQVVDWYLSHGFKMNTFTIQDLMPDTSYAYPVISHRILYPLLSVPFVAIFGIPGMLAVPALSLLALFIAIQRLANKFNKPLLGVAMVTVFSFSSTVTRWMFVNCTDALLVGLFAFAPAVLISLNQRKRWAPYALLLLVALTSATRFVLPFWLAIFLVLFFREKRYLRELLFMGFASVASIPALKAQLSTALLPGEVEISTFQKIVKTPIVLLKVIGIDFLEFAVLDRVFLVVMLFSLLQAIRLRKMLSSQLFIAVLSAGYLIGTINGTLGVNFRYQMPVLIFVAWLITDSINIQAKGLRLSSSSEGYVVINEAQQ